MLHSSINGDAAIRHGRVVAGVTYIIRIYIYINSTKTYGIIMRARHSMCFCDGKKLPVGRDDSKNNNNILNETSIIVIINIEYVTAVCVCVCWTDNL